MTALNKKVKIIDIHESDPNYEKLNQLLGVEGIFYPSYKIEDWYAGILTTTNNDVITFQKARLFDIDNDSMYDENIEEYKDYLNSIIGGYLSSISWNTNVSGSSSYATIVSCNTDDWNSNPWTYNYNYRINSSEENNGNGNFSIF